jgi:hypothetical protein
MAGWDAEGYFVKKRKRIIQIIALVIVLLMIALQVISLLLR